MKITNIQELMEQGGFQTQQMVEGYFIIPTEEETTSTPLYVEERGDRLFVISNPDYEELLSGPKGGRLIPKQTIFELSSRDSMFLFEAVEAIDKFGIEPKKLIRAAEVLSEKFSLERVMEKLLAQKPQVIQNLLDEMNLEVPEFLVQAYNELM